MTREKDIFFSDGWLSFFYNNFFQINVKDLKIRKKQKGLKGSWSAQLKHYNNQFLVMYIVLMSEVFYFI